MKITNYRLSKALAAASLLAASSALATTYYVSTTGSDSNSGSSSKPLATIMKAQSLASSGDTVIINAGTYKMANSYNSIQDGAYAVVNLINKDGITYKAASGTRPVFNFSAINPSGYRVAAFWVTASSVTFQGFDVINIKENITTGNNQSVGFSFYGGSSCTMNQVNVHDNEAAGITLEKVAANNLIYQCDSYNNTGINSYSYGNADGFGCHPDAGGTGNVFRQCRSWNNSDDGYDCINAAETVTFDTCWSYKNGNNGGNGNGFKVGGWGCSGGTMPSKIPVHTVKYCLSADNSSHGFYANHQPGQAANWTYNTAYNNSGADFDMLEGTGNTSSTCSVAGTREVMHYNLAYLGTITADYNESGSIVSNNTWTEGITPASSDFSSTDCQPDDECPLHSGACPPSPSCTRSAAANVLATAASKIEEKRAGVFVPTPSPRRAN